MTCDVESSVQAETARRNGRTIAIMPAYNAAATLERIRTVPEIIIHGDADPTVPVAGSRAMVAKLDRKSTRLNSSHHRLSRMPSSA